jgi:hypothetical protein
VDSDGAAGAAGAGQSVTAPRTTSANGWGPNGTETPRTRTIHRPGAGASNVSRSTTLRASCGSAGFEVIVGRPVPASKVWNQTVPAGSVTSSFNSLTRATAAFSDAG